MLPPVRAAKSHKVVHLISCSVSITTRPVTAVPFWPVYSEGFKRSAMHPAEPPTPTLVGDAAEIGRTYNHAASNLLVELINVATSQLNIAQLFSSHIVFEAPLVTRCCRLSEQQKAIKWRARARAFVCLCVCAPARMRARAHAQARCVRSRARVRAVHALARVRVRPCVPRSRTRVRHARACSCASLVRLSFYPRVRLRACRARIHEE